MRRTGGFTLIELLVAIAILALMAVMGWRGLDGMSQTQARLQQRADEVLALQAGLSQWGVDLDALVELPTLQALDWDGRALRLTRRMGAGVTEAVAVVAWSRREVEGTVRWLRWQSPSLRSRGEVQMAWAQASQWAQNPGDDLKAREVRIVPMAQWQIYFFRGGSWTNPLSASGDTRASGTAGAGTGVAAVMAAAAAATGASGVEGAVPQGVRLVLTLPPGGAVSGTLTRDWVLPTLGGGKS